MVLLNYLNTQCKKRIVAQHKPTQVACRLLGNSTKPCFLNNVCEASEQKGLLYFHTCVITGILAVYICLYWLLTFTRLSKPLGWLAAILFKPIAALLRVFAYCVQFYKGLPF